MTHTYFDEDGSQNRLTLGWTGRSFVQALTKQAAIVAIAREQPHCGGALESEVILRNLLRFAFDDTVSLAIENCSTWRAAML